MPDRANPSVRATTAVARRGAGVGRGADDGRRELGRRPRAWQRAGVAEPKQGLRDEAGARPEQAHGGGSEQRRQ